MEITAIVILIAVIRAIVSAFNERKPAVETVFTREPLCFSCEYAHIASGFREREAIVACTFGGSVRPLKFDVRDCTLYCNRNAERNLVRVIGFADTVYDGDYATVAGRNDYSHFSPVAKATVTSGPDDAGSSPAELANNS